MAQASTSAQERITRVEVAHAVRDAFGSPPAGRGAILACAEGANARGRFSICCAGCRTRVQRTASALVSATLMRVHRSPLQRTLSAAQPSANAARATKPTV